MGSWGYCNLMHGNQVEKVFSKSMLEFPKPIWGSCTHCDLFFSLLCTWTYNFCHLGSISAKFRCGGSLTTNCIGRPRALCASLASIFLSQSLNGLHVFAQFICNSYKILHLIYLFLRYLHLATLNILY